MVDLAAFEAWCLARGNSPRTAALYRADVARFLAWLRDTVGEPPDPAAITSLDVADYRRWLLSHGRKASTVNRALRSLRQWGTWAIAAGLAHTNPAADVRTVPEAPPIPRALPRADLARLLRAVERYGDLRDRTLLVLLAQTGLRVSELVALRWADLDIGPRHGWVTVTGKGGKTRRVPLSLTARHALEAWRREQHPSPDAYLFPGRRGGHLTTRAVQLRLRRYGTLAAVPVTPHVLRHTVCKTLVDAGVPLDRVALLAGHASLTTTARYTRATEQDLADSVRALDWI